MIHKEFLQKQAIKQLEYPAEAGFIQGIPSLQEGWRAETSDKSQNPQLDCQHREIQNGTLKDLLR